MSDNPEYEKELTRIRASSEKEKAMDWVKSASWKTSLMGVGTIFVSLGTIGKMLTTGAYDMNTITLALTTIGTGIGLIFAKDKNVTGAPPSDVAR